MTLEERVTAIVDAVRAGAKWTAGDHLHKLRAQLELDGETTAAEVVALFIPVLAEAADLHLVQDDPWEREERERDL